MLPTNRTQFKDYCLRKLGFPVVQINIDPEQLDDRIDEAIALGQNYHYDLRQAWYISYQIQAADITNLYIPMPADMLGVTKLFTLASAQVNSAGNGGFNMFDINYQIRLNELYDYTAGDYVYFEMANEHLRMLEMLFTGEIPIRYNKYTQLLYIDANWTARFMVGQFIAIEGYKALPDTALYWQDPWLMKYGTALIKRQWGENLKKFNSVTLPGGMILNGQKIWDEAQEECMRLEKELREQWEDPPAFIFG